MSWSFTFQVLCLPYLIDSILLIIITLWLIIHRSPYHLSSAFEIINFISRAILKNIPKLFTYKDIHRPPLHQKRLNYKLTIPTNLKRSHRPFSLYALRILRSKISQKQIQQYLDATTIIIDIAKNCDEEKTKRSRAR